MEGEGRGGGAGRGGRLSVWEPWRACSDRSEKFGQVRLSAALGAAPSKSGEVGSEVCPGAGSTAGVKAAQLVTGQWWLESCPSLQSASKVGECPLRGGGGRRARSSLGTSAPGRGLSELSAPRSKRIAAARTPGCSCDHDGRPTVCRGPCSRRHLQLLGSCTEVLSPPFCCGLVQ